VRYRIDLAAFKTPTLGNSTILVLFSTLVFYFYCWLFKLLSVRSISFPCAFHLLLTFRVHLISPTDPLLYWRSLRQMSAPQVFRFKLKESRSSTRCWFGYFSPQYLPLLFMAQRPVFQEIAELFLVDAIGDRIWSCHRRCWSLCHHQLQGTLNTRLLVNADHFLCGFCSRPIIWEISGAFGHGTSGIPLGNITRAKALKGAAQDGTRLCKRLLALQQQLLKCFVCSSSSVCDCYHYHYHGGNSLD